MNTLAKHERWNPFKEMDELHNQVATLFGLNNRGANGDAQEQTNLWAPPVDITEDEKSYLITAEVPGLSRDNIKVVVENGELRISGERKFEKEDRKYHRIERSYGSFTRTFSLPDDANQNKVSAEFKDGILRVHVAKDEARAPRSIEVKVS